MHTPTIFNLIIEIVRVSVSLSRVQNRIVFNLKPIVFITLRTIAFKGISIKFIVHGGRSY